MYFIISHGNAVPECEFSINGKILDAHGIQFQKKLLLLYKLVSYLFIISRFLYRSFVNMYK